MMQDTEIKKYWDDRAKQHENNPAATTDDIHLRDLEVKTITETLQRIALPQGARALDIGCGNGYSTIKVAQALPGISFLGIDYSESMIRSARQQLSEQSGLEERVRFEIGDATNLEASCGNEIFDVALTDRCLINLTSAQAQASAIAQIAAHVKPNGYYLAIENFMEGQEKMNEARRAVGVPEIPVRWHNLFFREKEFVASAEPFFDEITFHEFSSSYYFATRVVYSAMCQMRGESPDYNHEIHRVAPQLPWTGQFSPIRMVLLRRKSS